MSLHFVVSWVTVNGKAYAVVTRKCRSLDRKCVNMLHLSPQQEIFHRGPISCGVDANPLLNYESGASKKSWMCWGHEMAPSWCSSAMCKASSRRRARVSITLCPWLAGALTRRKRETMRDSSSLLHAACVLLVLIL